MRNFSRSRKSIIFSLVALVTLVGGFMVYGVISSNHAQSALAAGPAHSSHVQITKRGTTRFPRTVQKASPKALSASNGPEFLNHPEPELPKDEDQGTPPPNLKAPNPAPQSVTSHNRGLNGFNGLSHADQRLADNGNQFSLEPPDQALCAGNGFVLEGVNLALAVYSTGGQLTQYTLTAINPFFGLPSAINRSANPPVFGPFTSDPKCYFDHATQRWFVSVLEIDTDPATGAFTNNSNELLAVSQTNDPTGVWTIYSINTTDADHPNCPCFGDQPLLGADTNGIYLSTNEFPITGEGFNGAQIYAISKIALEAGKATTAVHIDASQVLVPFGGLSYSVQPAISASGLGDTRHNGTEYFLSALDFDGTLDNRIAAWALTNTTSLNSANPNLNLSAQVIKSETYGQPPAATQKPGPTPLGTSLGEQNLPEQLETNDDRMNQVFYGDGLLWSGVNTVVQTGKQSPRAGIAYFIVRPSVDNSGNITARLVGQGYVSVAKNNVFFPSIATNGRGQAIMTFTLSGPNYYPGAAYVTLTTRGTGPVHLAKAGAYPDDGFTGYTAYGGDGVGRWGDYSAALFDSDTGKVWFATEYIPSTQRTQLANWGTFVGFINPAQA